MAHFATNAFTQTLAPSATDLIRSDHTRVLGAFHRCRYKMEIFGARMMKRRLELKLPRAGEAARYSARAMSAAPLLVAAGALVAGAWLFKTRPSSRFR